MQQPLDIQFSSSTRLKTLHDFMINILKGHYLAVHNFPSQLFYFYILSYKYVIPLSFAEKYTFVVACSISSEPVPVKKMP